MSLRSKLLLVMVLLPLVCLAVFLTLSVKAFIEDKVTFVHEWNQLQSKYLSTKMKLIISQIQNNPDDSVFSARVSNTFDEVTDIRGAVRAEQVLELTRNNGAALCTNVRQLGWLYFQEHLIYGYCRKNANDYSLYVFKPSLLADLFSDHGLSDALLVGQDGYIIAGPPEYPIGRELRSIVGSGINDIFGSSTPTQGRLELVNQKDKIKYLVNFYRIPNESLMIISLTPRSAPQRAAMLFVYQGVIFVAGLLIVALFASLFISSAMLTNILGLHKAMTSFGNGDWNANISTRSKDEIGQLASMFNKMVAQIRDLMRIHEEKAKVDAEMSLAAELQKKFFPEANYFTSSFQFTGFYEPANQCGGDWWMYIDTQTHFIVCIGDVTGHGLQSALLTSAARAVVAEFKTNFEGPAHAMAKMNRAIHETSGGSLNMTCLIAAFDKKSQVVTYSNASHEPTYYFTPSSDLKKSDINVFLDVHGPRLGERVDAVFEESTVACNEPYVFLFYSDGLKDVVNPSGEAFDERRILRVLTKLQNAEITTKEVLDLTVSSVEEWRKGAPLVDDLSYFYVKTNFQGSASESQN